VFTESLPCNGYTRYINNINNNNNNNNNNSIQFFICLRAERNIQEPITESAQTQNNKSNKTKERKSFKNLWLFKFKYVFIKILIDLQTTLTAETHSTKRH
jgi:hypothetical protein